MSSSYAGDLRWLEASSRAPLSQPACNLPGLSIPAKECNCKRSLKLGVQDAK